MHTTAQHIIYCRPEYMNIHTFENLYRCETEYAVFCFDIIGKKAISLPKSPIGGISFLDKSQNTFNNAWRKIENELHEKGVSEIILTNQPDFYPNAIAIDWWKALGFEVVKNEITHHIDLTKPVKELLHPMEQRILSKPTDFVIQEESLEQLEGIHDFIAACRQAQNLQINIDYSTLLRHFHALPQQYKAFSVRKGKTLAAALIIVQVNNDIAYYYLPATHPHFKSESPMVHLMHDVYQYYQQRGVKIIDLGISSEDGVPQSGLVTFKERMGGLKSERVKLGKRFD